MGLQTTQLVEAESGGGIGQEGQNGSRPLRVGAPGRVPKVAHQNQAIDVQVLVATDQVAVHRFGRGDAHLDSASVSGPAQRLEVLSDGLPGVGSGGQGCPEAVPAIGLEHSPAKCGR